MTKTKIWLITAAALILIGIILLGGVMMGLKWDFGKLSTAKFETNNYHIDEDFQSISIKSSTADIVFTVTQDEKASVICFEEARGKHTVSVKEGTLLIEQVDTRKWFDHIGIFSNTPKITLCLPEGQYSKLNITESTGDIAIPKELSFEAMDISLSTGNVTNLASATNIKIKASTGAIYTENISADTVSLSTTTGKLTVRSVSCTGDINVTVSTGAAALTDVVCSRLISTGSTGDMKLENVVAAESISIKRTTGDVKLQSCDAGSLDITASTGNVTGNLLSEKIFITQTSTGKVNVPKSANGGICEITTSTGNIKFTIG